MSDFWSDPYMPGRSNSSGDSPMPLGCALAVIAVIVLWAISYAIWLPQTDRTVTAKVLKTWVSTTSEGHTNLIGTDHGVFEDQDSLLYWKWSSSDYFSNVQAGDTCTFHVVGWRIPISSAYPNIVGMECHK